MVPMNLDSVDTKWLAKVYAFGGLGGFGVVIVFLTDAQPGLQLPLQLAAVGLLTLGFGLEQAAGKAALTGRMIAAIGVVLLLAAVFADEPVWTRFSPLVIVWFLADRAYGGEFIDRAEARAA